MAYIPINDEAETLAVSTTAVGWASAPARAVKARVQVQDANIRVYVDGSTPTSTAGYVFYAGQWFELFGPEIDKFRAIRDDSTDAACAVTFYSGEPNAYDN